MPTGVLRSIKSRRSKEETKIIRKAFNLAVNAHRNDRRKSGEPYIFHPLAVANLRRRNWAWNDFYCCL